MYGTGRIDCYSSRVGCLSLIARGWAGGPCHLCHLAVLIKLSQKKHTYQLMLRLETLRAEKQTIKTFKLYLSIFHRFLTKNGLTITENVNFRFGMGRGSSVGPFDIPLYTSYWSSVDTKRLSGTVKAIFSEQF